jgi:hypothetical protein
MSIVSRVYMFGISLLLGFGQGFQPVCGFNYGARLYDRVLQAFWFCVKLAAVMMFLMAVAGFIMAPGIIAQFRKDDPDVIRIGTDALRMQCVTFSLSSWIVINNMLLQTIGKAAKASILPWRGRGFFFLPMILVLPHLFGVVGIQLSQPIADVMTFILAIPMGISVLRELKARAEQRGRGRGSPFEEREIYQPHHFGTFRYGQRYFTQMLKERQIPMEVGQLPFMMQVYRHPGISQDGISANAVMDKGTTAKCIKQL